MYAPRRVQCLTIRRFAPGAFITSAWSRNNGAAQMLSGTSPAAAHVAGLVAYLISVEGNRTPAAMSARLKALALKGKITGLRASMLHYTHARTILTFGQLLELLTTWLTPCSADTKWFK